MEDNFFEMYLEEMGEIPALAREEKDSVLEGTARGDMAARSRLVEGSLRAVLEIAKVYGDRELPLSDLVQEANAALMLAAVEYDGSEPWEELMDRRVREGVELALEEQKTEHQIEETMTARVNVLQTVSQVLAGELGREATLEELAGKMKMSQDEIKDIMKLALDALSVNGEGQASDAAEDDQGLDPWEEAQAGNPIKDGWNLEEGL